MGIFPSMRELLAFRAGATAADEAPAPERGDASPLFIPGQRGGMLCLHGFTGTPFEVKPLAEALGREGYAVGAPVLAGHGRTAAELVRTRWSDWLASARKALEHVRREAGGRPVGLVGFSAGGLLALRLAAENPQGIAALAILSAPLRLRSFQVRAIRTLALAPKALRQNPLFAVPKLSGSDVTDPNMRDRNPGLRSMPIAGLRNLVELMEVVRRDLQNIKLPLFVAHGLLDQTVPLDDSLEIAGSVASDTVERLWLERSGHLVGIDVEKQRLSAALVRFFHRFMPPR